MYTSTPIPSSALYIQYVISTYKESNCFNFILERYRTVIKPHHQLCIRIFVGFFLPVTTMSLDQPNESLFRNSFSSSISSLFGVNEMGKNFSERFSMYSNGSTRSLIDFLTDTRKKPTSWNQFIDHNCHNLRAISPSGKPTSMGQPNDEMSNTKPWVIFKASTLG